MLSVKLQYETDMVVYALVNTDCKDSKVVDIWPIGAGFPIQKEYEDYTFLDTVTMLDDSFVQHIFCKEIERK